MFDKKASDDGFRDAEFYTLLDLDAILVLKGKEYRNDYSGVKEFVKQLHKEDYQDLIFQIKAPNGRDYNVMPTRVDPISMEFNDEIYVELVEMEGLILDGKYNKYLKISNKQHIFDKYRWENRGWNY